MRRTVNIWWVIAIFACVLTAFFWYSSKLNTTIAELEDRLERDTVRLAALEAENADLEAVLKTVGTDAFVETQARNEYSYMMPDEIRFIITGQDGQYQQDQAEVPSP